MTVEVVIVGAGPSGTALACFLALAGIRCMVFDSDSESDDLVVGESLVPAAIPIIRRLGIEDEVATVSRRKHGAALRHGNGSRVDMEFRRQGSAVPGYAYNIPRPQFDRIVKARAKALGVHFINQKARLAVCPADSERDLALCDASLQAAGLSRAAHPPMLVDATGRKRLFARLLDIPAVKGTRNGVAHFAHYKQFEADSRLEGQIVISVLNHGWSWQIPLKDTLSVGVVINRKVMREYGSTPQERLERAIGSNSLLAGEGRMRQRVSDVQTYTNYQQMTTRSHGNGWVMVGDTFGFVDPMLSPGVFMALRNAELLADLVLSKAAPEEADFMAYTCEMQSWHKAWESLITHFYDGRVLSLGELRREMRQTRRPSVGKVMEPFVSKALASMVSGAGTRSSFNARLLSHSLDHVLKDPALIRSHAVQHG